MIILLNLILLISIVCKWFSCCSYAVNRMVGLYGRTREPAVFIFSVTQSLTATLTCLLFYLVLVGVVVCSTDIILLFPSMWKCLISYLEQNHLLSCSEVLVKLQIWTCWIYTGRDAQDCMDGHSKHNFWYHHTWLNLLVNLYPATEWGCRDLMHVVI